MIDELEYLKGRMKLLKYFIVNRESRGKASLQLLVETTKWAMNMLEEELKGTNDLIQALKIRDNLDVAGQLVDDVVRVYSIQVR